MQSKKVAVLGATGVAGQQFLAALANHPFFEVVALAASARSAGKTYEKAITNDSGALQWFGAEPLVPQYARQVVYDALKLDPRSVDLVFAAVESDAARELEPRFAQTTPVVSTASAFRYEEDVPVFIPGVNLNHADLIQVQRRQRGWNGFITPVPNCTTMGLAMTLKPLADAFGIRQVLMTSLQSCSGAGRSPGVMALDIVDNVIPYIPKEEEKVQRETQKILGQINQDRIEPAAFPVSATCTRVPVLDGHTEVVNVSLLQSAPLEAVKEAWQQFGAAFVARKFPSCPSRLIQVTEDPFRPQPRRDRDTEDGMVTTVGRVRVDPALANGIKYVLVSHNTKMGAAKGAILVAESLVQAGYI
jgi:aspartate-semialdehyde dehydrogenase